MIALVFAAGVLTGVVGLLAVAYIAVGSRREAGAAPRPLPPASAREIKQAEIANRANLRELRFVSPANADFDSEETR